MAILKQLLEALDIRKIGYTIADAFSAGAQVPPSSVVHYTGRWLRGVPLLDVLHSIYCGFDCCDINYHASGYPNRQNESRGCFAL